MSVKVPWNRRFRVGSNHAPNHSVSVLTNTLHNRRIHKRYRFWKNTKKERKNEDTLQCKAVNYFTQNTQDKTFICSAVPFYLKKSHFLYSTFYISKERFFSIFLFGNAKIIYGKQGMFENYIANYLLNHCKWRWESIVDGKSTIL